MSTEVALVKELNRGLTSMAPQFEKALPAHVSVDRFVRVVMTSVNSNPDLMRADRKTLFAAATHAAQFGLLPDGREGAIVSFFNKKAGIHQCQFMPMVAGVMKMVRNSGEISTWTVEAVYENDEFDFQLGDEPFISHRPKLSGRGKMIAVYSIVTMKDGEKSREVMSVEDIEGIKKRSRTSSYGPWVTDYAEMAKKTVIRRHSKRLPSSTDLDGLVSADDDLFTSEPATPEPVVAHERVESADVVAETPPPKTARKRASRLDVVADQAPVDNEPYTDVEMNEPPAIDPADMPEYDSPI